MCRFDSAEGPMPDEEEYEEAANSIDDLSEAADLIRCPNCGEMTPEVSNVCESCGYLIRKAEVDGEDEGFQEKLNMTLKPYPSQDIDDLEDETFEERPEVFPELAELEKSLEETKEPLQKVAKVVETPVSAQPPRRSSLVAASVVVMVVGITTYLLSFFLVTDRALAGAGMVLGAVLIVVFANTAAEGALASRRPMLKVPSGPSRKIVQYICPSCRTPLTEEESECPICGSSFDS